MLSEPYGSHIDVGSAKISLCFSFISIPLFCTLAMSMFWLGCGWDWDWGWAVEPKQRQAKPLERAQKVVGPVMGHICTHTHTPIHSRSWSGSQKLTGLILFKDKAQINHTAAKIMKCSCVQITQNYRKQKPEHLPKWPQKSFNYIEHATGNRSSSSCPTRMSESATAADPSFSAEGRVL